MRPEEVPLGQTLPDTAVPCLYGQVRAGLDHVGTWHRHVRTDYNLAHTEKGIT
jgi:hypothetical protein